MDPPFPGTIAPYRRSYSGGIEGLINLLIIATGYCLV
jgi:hypothetical protein